MTENAEKSDVQGIHGLELSASEDARGSGVDGVWLKLSASEDARGRVFRIMRHWRPLLS